MKYCLVLTTVGSLVQARKLAGLILKSSLGACVSISSRTESHYIWKGAVQKSREHVLSIKTRRACFEKLSRLIKKHHSYDTPEIICLPIEKGSSDYLKWIESETRV